MSQSKTPNARVRRASRKPAEVLDPDDPEFDAKLDASIERAYERIEDELNRMIEDLRAFRAVPVHIGTNPHTNPHGIPWVGLSRPNLARTRAMAYRPTRPTVERINPGSTLARTRAMAFRAFRLNPSQR